jgi:hypothetical protein
MPRQRSGRKRGIRAIRHRQAAAGRLGLGGSYQRAYLGSLPAQGDSGQTIVRDHAPATNSLSMTALDPLLTVTTGGFGEADFALTRRVSAQ